MSVKCTTCYMDWDDEDTDKQDYSDVCELFVDLPIVEANKANHNGDIYNEDCVKKMAENIAQHLSGNGIIPVTMDRIEGDKQIIERIGTVCGVNVDNDGSGVVTVKARVDMNTKESLYLAENIGRDDKHFSYDPCFYIKAEEIRANDNHTIGITDCNLRHVTICEHYSKE